MNTLVNAMARAICEADIDLAAAMFPDVAPGEVRRVAVEELGPEHYATMALAALKAMREPLIAQIEALKYTQDQVMDHEMECVNDGLDQAIAVIRSELQEHSTPPRNAS